MVWRVSWAISVDGVDASSAMNPYLMSIEVTDKDGAASDSARLVFDDTDGQVMLPRAGAKVAISLQGAPVFEGVVDEVESSGGRGQGREIGVSCKGVDSRAKPKQPLDLHKDDSDLQGFLDEAAKAAGLAGVTIDPQFAQVRRPYWSASGESLLHLGRRLAEELGGTFKIRGDRAVLAKRGEGRTPSGAAMPVVRAAWGDNLMSWSIRPFQGRPRFTQARGRYFDRKEARWKEIDVEVAGRNGAPPAIDVIRFPKADGAQARGAAQGRKTESEREGGEGSVSILLAPEAQAEGGCVIVGVRPGIDGLYRISSITHRVDRGGGASTSLDLKQPQGEAGKDARQPAP